VSWQQRTDANAAPVLVSTADGGDPI